MTNLHTFWLACLHCPAIVVTGVSAIIVVFAAVLVSMAAMGCMAQSKAAKIQPGTRQNTPGCAPDVLHVVF